MNRLAGRLPRRLGAVALASLFVAALALGGAGSVAPARALSIKCGIIFGHSCLTVTFTLFGDGTGDLETTDSTYGTPDGNIACHRELRVTSGTCSFGYDVSATAPAVHVYVSVRPDARSSVCQINIGCEPEIDVPYVLSSSTTIADFAFIFTEAVTVTVSKVGIGHGTVTSEPMFLACGSTCSAEFESGTTVQLTATPDASSVFTGWVSGCAGTNPVCSLSLPNVSGVLSTVAEFEPKPVTPPPTQRPTAAPVATPRGTAVPAAPTPAATLAQSGTGETAPAAASSPGASSPAPSQPGSASAAAPTAQPASAITSAAGMDLTPIALAIVIAAIVLAGGLALGLRGRRS